MPAARAWFLQDNCVQDPYKQFDTVCTDKGNTMWSIHFAHGHLRKAL